jgi:phosphatidylglycerophosphate synthase
MPDAARPDAREYRSEDRAILLRLYQGLFWERLVAALPRRLTPNTITLVAEACALSAPIATALAVQGRPIFYLVSGLLLFAYMTGDNIDGQHARRTGQTSALGEFLDHGIDGLASCAVLLCSALALRVEGPWLAGLVGLGSLGFGSVFWAQYRTGILVTPRLSAMEGVTGASLFQLAMFALGEPSWLRFSPGALNAASALLVILGISYVYATASPILRARREGAKPAELFVPLAVACLAVAAAIAGAGGLAPSILVAVFVAEIVCRMILMRRRGSSGSIAHPAQALMILPLAAALVPALARLAPALAWAGAAIAFAIYARTFLGGVIAIEAEARKAAKASPAL